MALLKAKSIFEILGNTNMAEECLKLAEEKKLTSIAFPCISAGVYGCPIKLSAKVAIDTIEAYLKQYKGSLTVSLACFKDSEYEAYKAYAKEINLQ